MTAWRPALVGREAGTGDGPRCSRNAAGVMAGAGEPGDPETAGRCLSRQVLALLIAAALCLAEAPQSAAGNPALSPAVVEHPLEPPDTSSPRATLRTFLDYGREGWRSALDQYREHPNVRKHAGCCLDLSKVPLNRRSDVGLEHSIMLFDVFNRIPLPAIDDVPDKTEMDRRGETQWVIPKTPITIERVAEGSRAGEWLFSTATVNRIPDFYRRTRHLPPGPDAVVEDGYKIYQAQAGWILPAAWRDALPDAANRLVFDQTLWQWFLLVVSLAVAGWLGWKAVRWSRRPAEGRRPGGMRTLAGPAALMLLTLFLDYFIDEQVNITGALLAALQQLFTAVFYLAVIWAVLLIGRVLVDAVVNSPRIDLTRLSADLVRLMVRTLTFGLVLAVAAIWLHSVGVPVLGVVAGLGIGGVAIALAAQRTIENFFGAIMLYTDRPVRIGDFCRFGDKMGTVERIGLRSTQIRTLDRTVLNVPNAEFSRLQLENFAPRDKFLFRTTLNLRLETTPEQLQLVLYRLGALLKENDRVSDDPCRVRLVSIGPYSLDVEIYTYIESEDMNSFHAIREDLYLEMLKEIEAAGTQLAPPANVQYYAVASAVEARPEEESRPAEAARPSGG